MVPRAARNEGQRNKFVSPELDRIADPQDWVGPIWAVFNNQILVRASEKAVNGKLPPSRDSLTEEIAVAIDAELKTEAIRLWQQIIGLGAESPAASAPAEAATYALLRRMQDGHSGARTTQAEKKAKGTVQRLAKLIRDLDTQIYGAPAIPFENLGETEKFICQSLARVRSNDQPRAIHESLVNLVEGLEREAIRYSRDHDENGGKVPGGTQAAVLVRAKRNAVLSLASATNGITNQWAFLKSLVNLMDIPPNGSGELIVSSKDLYDEHRKAVKWMSDHTPSGQ